ncbi:hypothetical protein SARC_13174, partial [Sphaeroforma arctica JP610]
MDLLISSGLATYYHIDQLISSGLATYHQMDLLISSGLGVCMRASECLSICIGMMDETDNSGRLVKRSDTKLGKAHVTLQLSDLDHTIEKYYKLEHRKGRVFDFELERCSRAHKKFCIRNIYWRLLDEFRVRY